jgi:hypothetical protein
MSFEHGMVCAIDSRNWGVTSKAFWGAMGAYVDLRSKEIEDRDFDANALEKADHDLRAACAEVARYVTSDPDAVRDKNRMYQELMSASAFLGDVWLESVANTLLFSMGEIPPGYSLSDFGFKLPIEVVWKPAAELWSCYSESRPTDAALRSVICARPATVDELADKLKVVAYSGMGKALNGIVSFDPGDHPEEGVLITLTNRILGASTEQCIAAFECRRTFEDILGAFLVENAPTSAITTTECCLLGLGLAPRDWRVALCRDYERLQG